jgi:hypothetical protein
LAIGNWYVGQDTSRGCIRVSQSEWAKHCDSGENTTRNIQCESKRSGEEPYGHASSWIDWCHTFAPDHRLSEALSCVVYYRAQNRTLALKIPHRQQTP